MGARTPDLSAFRRLTVSRGLGLDLSVEMPSSALPISVVLPALATSFLSPMGAQVVCHDRYGDYAAGSQVESGSNGSSGTGINGGTGWGGPYDVSNAIKSLVKIEDRTANPILYLNGEVVIAGGNRALRFDGVANGTYAVHRPLGTSFSAAAGEILWFSLLFRTNNPSPLANQDFFQIGFDDNDNAAGGIPRVSIGANTTSSTFPAPFHFFARSTTASGASAFDSAVPIAGATTYLLVACIEPHDGVYDTVSLFINPGESTDPGPPSATITLPSGLATLSHSFIRTVNLESGDVYVLDEWYIGRDYGSVVQSLDGTLRITGPPSEPPVVIWPAALTGVTLETSTTLEIDSWSEVTGPFTLDDGNILYGVPTDPGIPRRFFRLRR